MTWIFIITGIVLIAGGIVFLMFFYEKDERPTIDRIQNLNRQKYDPNMTRFAARKEASAAVPRVELLSQLSQETSALTNIIEREAAAIQTNYRKEDSLTTYALEREKQIADHESYMALADNQTTVARLASQMGLDPSTMKELILEKARMGTLVNSRSRTLGHRKKISPDLRFNRNCGFADS